MYQAAEGFFRALAAIGPRRIGALAWVASGVALVAVAVADVSDPKTDPQGVTIIHTMRQRVRSVMSAAYGTPTARKPDDNDSDQTS
jgi:hypothetical protein